MNEKMLVIPLRHFAQTTFRTTQTIPASGSQQVQLNATGLRSGSIKYIDLWVTQNGVPAGNPWKYVPLTQLQFLVNGLIYYDSSFSNQAIWNLCDSKVPLSVSATSYASSATPITGSTTLVAAQTSMPWYRISLGQISEPVAFSNDLTLGLNVANSVCNINLTCDPSYAGENITISLSYHYASNLIAHAGTMEYLFT